MKRFLRNKNGAIAIYIGLMMPLLIGAGVLSIDIGRMVVVKTQMQDAADAAAISAAVQLDTNDGAISRAQTAAHTALANKSRMFGSSSTLSVDTGQTVFYSEYTPGKPGSGTATTADGDATFVKIVLSTKNLDLYLMPVLGIVASGVSDLTAINAYAVAENPGDISCNVSNFLVCDYIDPGTGESQYTDANNFGKMLEIKEGPTGGLPAPGQFGLICADPQGTQCSADAVSAALASDGFNSCVGPGAGVFTSAPGSKTQPVVRGVNTRFDIEDPADLWTTATQYLNPAKDIVAFPDDGNYGDVALPQGALSDGTWNASDYYDDAHNCVGCMPADLSGNADLTRFQTYLYQSGVDFCMNGKNTQYPIPSGGCDSGYTAVTGTGPVPTADVGDDPTVNDCLVTGTPESCDGEPVAANWTGTWDGASICDDYDVDNNGLDITEELNCRVGRRMLTIIVADCPNEVAVDGSGVTGIQGQHTYSTKNVKLVDFFLTREVDPPGGSPGKTGGSQAAVNAELIGPSSKSLGGSGGAGPGLHINVRLIE